MAVANPVSRAVISSAANTGLRNNPKLDKLFKAAESRQLTDQELNQYCRIVPEQSIRADVAREMAVAEEEVVKATVDEIFAVFPFEKMHGDYSPDKCVRDVTYVSAYATMSMLMSDKQWFADKMLYWMRTMVQAFDFPVREQEKRRLFGPKQDPKLAALLEHSDTLPGYISALYVTYSRLAQNYESVLNPQAWKLMQPYLQFAVDVLTEQK